MSDRPTLMDSTPSPKGESKPSVGSVVQAISVLRHLGTLEGGAGVTAIAKSLGLSPSSCFNILKTLVAEEFLEFDSRQKTYRLGLGAIDLTRHALGTSRVFPALKNKLQALSDQYHIAVGLWRLVGQKRLVLVGVAESEQATRIHLEVGQRVPLLAGAIGRCWAASKRLPAQEIAKGLDEVQWQSRPLLEDYLRQVEAARRLGFAIDSGQWRRGVTTVAAPINDEEGVLRFGITGSMFAEQHDHTVMQAACEQIRDLALYAGRRAFGTARTIRPSVTAEA
jgi:IclR family transcriptional regulator, acetate operon repressor